jgi:DNA polymerase-3 subunit beta
MKLVAKTKPLIDALDAAAQVIKPLGSLPVLTCALVECDQAGVRITCDSIEARVSVMVEGAKADKPFAFLVAPKMLRHSLRADEARITLDGLKLNIESGGTTKLSTLPTKDFPQQWKAVPRHPVDSLELLSAIKSTSALVDPHAADLSGVIYWDREHGRMVGCGGSTMAASPVAFLMDGSFLLPAAHARTILNCFSVGDQLSAGVFDTVFCVSSPTRTLYARLMSGQYPNYNTFIPESDPFSTLDREALIGALKGLSGFMDEYHRVSVTVVGSTWTLRAGNGDNESAVEIGAKVVREVGAMTINATKILALVQNWACDSISVTLRDGKLLLHPETKTGQIGATTLFREVERA